MKIFAVINNYGTLRADASAAGCRTTWYTMPDSSLLRSGNPFFVPDADGGYEAFASICVRVGRLGKSVAPRFAGRYIDGWTMATAVIATRRLAELRAEGLPWTQAVVFDRSCMLGNLQPIDTLNQYDSFEVEHAGSISTYSPELLRNDIAETISRLSAENTIKTGDLILAGLTEKGIGLIEGNRLTIRNNDYNLLDINIK